MSASLDESAMLQLIAAWPEENASPQDVADFLDASDETPEDGGLSERATVIRNMRLRGVAASQSAWDEFLTVLNAVVAVAGVVTAVSSAITGAYAVTQI